MGTRQAQGRGTRRIAGSLRARRAGYAGSSVARITSICPLPGRSPDHALVNAHRWGNDEDLLRGQKGDSDFLNSKDGDGRDILMCGSGRHDQVKADPGDTVSDSCDIVVGAASSQLNVVSEAKAEQIAANRLN